MPMEFNAGFFEALSKSPEVTALCVAKAEQIMAAAQASAPVDSGDYKGAFRVRVKYQRRAVAVVENTDPKAMIIESKTGNLARAVRAARRG